MRIALAALPATGPAVGVDWRRGGVGGRGRRRRGERRGRRQGADEAHRAIGVVVFDLDEHDARTARVAVGDRARRCWSASRPDRAWLGLLGSPVKKKMSSRVESAGSKVSVAVTGLAAADVVELVPEALRRARRCPRTCRRCRSGSRRLALEPVCAWAVGRMPTSNAPMSSTTAQGASRRRTDGDDVVDATRPEGMTLTSLSSS